MELGIYTFAELRGDPHGSHVITPQQRLKNLMEEIELADQVRLDVFGVGEHHRPDFAVSAPAVVLAAAAMRTKTIGLTSAVSVLSSDDPVRVYQAFSTVDLLSGGRAEIMVGRGSFIESFPLFGYDLQHYDELFSEKLELLLKIRESEHVTGSGRHRAALNGVGVYPRPTRKIPIWVAVGGTPESAIRAGTLGLPMALAIIGGLPERFKPFADIFREALRKSGHDAAKVPLGINSHGYVAKTSQEARDDFFPSYAAMMNAIGRERGWSGITRGAFDNLTERSGALVVGSPSEVVDKILFQHEIFGHERFLMQMSVGTMPHANIMQSIQLFGTQVAPQLRAALGTTATPQGQKGT
jgi:probable LLM family oxidoreductase